MIFMHNESGELFELLFDGKLEAIAVFNNNLNTSDVAFAPLGGGWFNPITRTNLILTDWKVGEDFTFIGWL